MAGPSEHRDRLRAERIANEQATAGARARRRRVQMISAGLGAAVVAVAVVIVLVVSSGGSRRHVSAHLFAAGNTSASGAASGAGSGASPEATPRQRVDTLLSGIPESGDNVLGRPNAPYTIIEYGDLECVICDSFALGPNARVSDGTRGTGIEDAIIDQIVRKGIAKLVYASLDTATANGATPTEFIPQQTAAYAAGLQGKAWYFIELFYNEQHPEGSNYVNQAFLDGIARQVPGLNYAQWLTDCKLTRLRTQVLREVARGTTVDGNAAATPTVVVQSKRAGVLASRGIPSLDQVEQAINEVA